MLRKELTFNPNKHNNLFLASENEWMKINLEAFYFESYKRLVPSQN